MPDHYRAARLLACSLALAGVRILPSGGNRIDCMLRDAFAADAFPAWFRACFEFADGRTGLVAIGWADVVWWLVFGGLMEPMWGSGLRVLISADTARRLLPDGVGEDDARRWGVRLAEAIEFQSAPGADAGRNHHGP
jgi:hypothetical protein